MLSAIRYPINLSYLLEEKSVWDYTGLLYSNNKWLYVSLEDSCIYIPLVNHSYQRGEGHGGNLPLPWKIPGNILPLDSQHISRQWIQLNVFMTFRLLFFFKDDLPGRTIMSHPPCLVTPPPLRSPVLQHCYIILHYCFTQECRQWVWNNLLKVTLKLSVSFTQQERIVIFMHKKWKTKLNSVMMRHWKGMQRQRTSFFSM